MKVGYGRVSTLDQRAGMEAQLRELRAVGCEKIFQEQVSSVAKRPQLETCLEFIREGDTLVVAKLDRLARSTANLLEIAERVKAMGVKPIYKHFKHDGVTGPNMATVYSDRGFGVRAPVVFYNRSNEAAAQLKPGDFDWKAIFAGPSARQTN